MGQWSTLSIQLYDSLKNPITEVQDIATADVLVTLTLGGNYTTIQANCTISINPSAVVCRYMVTAPGWYNLYVYSGISRSVSRVELVAHDCLNYNMMEAQSSTRSSLITIFYFLSLFYLAM